MAGRTSSQAVTRYAGIQVQTSALGVNIPLGWGTFRCKCNLLDYLDFKSSPQKASAGKGGSTTTGYNYSATLILGVCEGPIDNITAVYVDSQVYTQKSTSPLAQVALSLSKGAVGQPVWSYLTSKHPGHAIGYSGLAIVYASNYGLDGGATPPNHSFEVVRTTGFGPIEAPSGGADVDPSLVIADFFENSRTGVPGWPSSGLIGDLTQYQDYCLAAGLLLSPLLDSQRSASDFLTEVLLATNSDCVWSEGVLKFIPYGDTTLTGNGKTYVPRNTPVYSLGDDDFVQDHSGDPVLQVDIEDQSDAYNVVQLEYLDRTNQYNMAIALASDAANVAQYGLRRQDPTTTHVICDPTVAALAAQLHLQRTLYIRAQYKFKLGWMFALLEPGDIVELTDAGMGLSRYPVRVIQIDEDEKYGLSLVCEDYPIGVSHSPLYQMQAGAGAAAVVDQTIDPGGVEANLFLWSDDRSQAAYALTNSTIARAAANDQYGLATADTVIPTNGVNGQHLVSQGIAVGAFFAGLPYTFSVCLQAGAHSKAIVRIGDGQGDGIGLNVDLSAGQIVSAFNDGANPGNVVLIGSSMASTLVGGIWQVTLTVEMASAAAGVNSLNCQLFVPDNAFNQIWTGDGSNALYTSQWQVRQGVAIGTYAATSGAAAGPIVLAPPPALGSGSAMYAAVAGGPNWGGAYVWASIDGTNYEEIGAITAPARFGRLTAAFAAHADPDTVGTLSLDLGWSGGELTSASSTAAVDNGATTSWIGPAGELISFETATLTNPCRYNVGAYIRRGFMNTPVAAHNAGDLFVRLDDAVFEFPYLDVNSGQAVYLKFQSFNTFGKGLVPLADCIAYAVTPNPVAANAPGAGAWTAVAATLSAGGVVVPMLEITGVIDNPSATSIEFYYRQTGAGAWTTAGSWSPKATAAYISTVVSGDQYDVAVSYTVGGVETPLTQIGSGLTISSSVASGIVGQGTLATAGIFGSFANLAAAVAAGVTNGQTWYNTTLGQVFTYTAPDYFGAYPSLASAIAAGLQNGQTWFDTSNSTVFAYLNQADSIVNQAPAATDTTIQAGATKNITTYSATAPGGPANGDIWVDTGANPNITYLYAGGWQIAANYVTGTSQLVDTANLGQTAVWSSVSTKPANVAALGGSEDIQNAILQAALTGGSVVPAVASQVAGQGALATLNQTDTPQIVVGAVSTSASAYTSASMSVPAGVLTTIQSVTVSIASGLVTIQASTQVWGHSGVGDGTIYVYRGSTLLYTGYAPLGGATTSATTIPALLSDSPGPGTYTYTMQALNGTFNINCQANYLNITELKV